ncbi:DUF4041 domain-containing protein [Epilithonimonas hominis]|uniref:T5orf172 domain-containing protein n=1 Tax=Epilithonimonas hominis TaxID=420404 RepID=A0A1H6LKQ4_9FLAO|nr:DUF4041 domain-containing protein [Epilithonimonas hominis]SEH85950.1 T5orf172 domain-containing protein [Epilithonimonas hominis]
MTAFLVIVILLLIILIFNISSKKNKEIIELKAKNQESNSTIQQLNDSNNKLNFEISDLLGKVNSLSKYQGLVDLEKKANEIIAEADIYKQKILDEEVNIISQAKETLSSAKNQANVILLQAQTKLDSSVNESAKIIQNAEIKATEIAGSAYEAMKNANEYEKTVIAMKNIIKGYGDEYLKPTFSLLDDLSEEFGHTDAGQNLKTARERNNSLVRTNLAATCNYVEQNRKETAINFVLDAFNGKVDSILSKVKKDNYGILEQKIKDSFQVVNNNGKAFRNAEITNEYLDSRLDELKWAVITQELKWQEKEEQRIIREQIREEEKARREYEKAIKEAEKEEQLLKKLIEKAQKEVEKANEEEKSKFLAQLYEFQEKLKLAEEKNQRAISMAQQTKAGNVYIISNIGSFGEDIFKIGMTRRLEPLDRVRELGDASVPFEFDVHALIYSDNAPLLERQLHKKFLKLQLNKVNPRKEFFNVNLTEIKNACIDLGITAKWTMIAEAKQYRESLALAEAIKNNKQLEEEWENFQEEAEIEIQEAEIEAIE